MGRKITDFNGIKKPVDGVNLYGNIKNDPGGTSVDETSNSDVQVFFQRMAALAGVALNSLPEDAINGFQFTTALNTLWANRLNGMAEAAGSPTGTFVPVIMSGLAPVSAGYTAGYFFYNGKFYFAPAFVNSTFPTLGQSVVIGLGGIDGQPVVVSAGVSTTVTPDAGSFNYENRVSWAASVGLLVPGWTDVTLNSGWSHGTSHFQYRVDVAGRVFLRGEAIAGGGATVSVATLPTTARPAKDSTVVGYGKVSGTTGVYPTSITAAGVVSNTNGGGDLYYFDGVTYFNN